MNRPTVMFLILGLIVGGVGGYGIAQLSNPGQVETIEDERLGVALAELSSLQAQMDETILSLGEAQNEASRLELEVITLQDQIGDQETQVARLQGVEESRDEAFLELLEKEGMISELQARVEELDELMFELDLVKADLLAAEENVQNLEGEISQLLEFLEDSLRIELGEIELVNSFGNPLENLQIGSLAIIQSTATNIFERTVAFTYLVRVIDTADESVVFEQSFINLQVNEGDFLTPGVSWSPESPGTFRIEVSCVDNLVNLLPVSFPRSIEVVLN